MGAYSDEVLFIHVPKCAGWSVKQYMKEVLPGFVVPKDVPGKLPLGHTALRDMEQWTGRKPESYQKIIAVIRDPYERELSEWNYRRDRFAKGWRHIFDIIAAAHTTLTSFMLDPMSELHRLNIERPGQTRGIKSPDSDTYTTYGGFWMYWLAIDGEIPANVQILRQERLSEQLPEALLPFANAIGVKVESLNATSHDEARKYHTLLSVQLTEQKCKWAFDNYYKRLSEKE